MPTLPVPALPPKVIGFRAALDTTAKIDVGAGTMRGIAVVTGNLQPAGWPMWVDAKSLVTFHAAFSALGPAKSYITHDGAPWADRQGREIGLFGTYRNEGNVFRADFEALAAYRKHQLASFEHLFELATKAPATFGVSPVFSYTLAWVRQNGEEVPTEVASWRWDDAVREYIPVFEPSQPADSTTLLPCVRVVEAKSIDFTDEPATNPGLFSAKPPVDVPGKGTSPANQNTPAMSLHKTLFAKFRSNPQQLARAIELHEGDEKLTLDAIVSTIDREQTTAEIGTLREQVKTKDGEIGTLREQVKTKDGEIATLREQIKTKDDEIASFRKEGAPPVPVGGNGGEGSNGDPIAKLRSDLAAITGTDAESSRKRGQITAQLRALKNKKK